jgi:hypothetical protein
MDPLGNCLLLLKESRQVIPSLMNINDYTHGKLTQTPHKLHPKTCLSKRERGIERGKRDRERKSVKTLMVS